MIKQVNGLIKRHNKLIDTERNVSIKEDKLRIIDGDAMLDKWLKVIAETKAKIAGTEHEKVFISRYHKTENYILSSGNLHMDFKTNYKMQNEIYAIAINFLYKYDLIDYGERKNDTMNEISITAQSDPTLSGFEDEIKHAAPFSLIKLSGIFKVKPKTQILLGKEIVKSRFHIGGSDLVIDGSAAQIVLDVEQGVGEQCLFFLDKHASNVTLRNLNIVINYTGVDTSARIFAFYNMSYALKICGVKIKMNSCSQVNMTGIYNYGGLDTHLETQADNLQVCDSDIRLQAAAKTFEKECYVCGIYNRLANSISVRNNYIYSFIKGCGSRQQAVGIYNSGRFARINDNNIKAHGMYNTGMKVDEAHSFGLINEGMYALISNNNCIGEWGGLSVGLENRAYFAKIEGNKILATHTVEGYSLRNSGPNTVIANNIITSTSRNARLMDNSASHVIITSNFMQVLMDFEECRSGCGMRFKDCCDCTVTDNHVLGARNCGIFIDNSRLHADNNTIWKTAEDSTFKEIAYTKDRLIADLLREDRIVTIE